MTGVVYNDGQRYSTERNNPSRGEVARYARSEDYHVVIDRRLDLARRVDARAGAQSVRGAHVRRYGSCAGAHVRSIRRTRLDRQEHVPDQPGSRLLDSPRRDHLQPAARDRRAIAGSVRHVHPLPRGVPHRRVRRRRMYSTPRVAFPISRSNIEARSPKSIAWPSAIMSLAVTSARKSARGIAGRFPKPTRRGRRVRI